MFGHGAKVTDEALTALLVRLRQARLDAQAGLQDAEQRAVQFMDAELRSRECAAEHRARIHGLNVEIDDILDRLSIPRQP